jgi:putative MFS transporter
LLRRLPQLEPRHWRLLAVIGAANVFDNYDIAILSQALLQIQTGLAIPEAEIGGVVAVIRLGVLPAIALMVLADRVGRRTLMIGAILGFAICTFLTAFARDAREFMAVQFLARIFISAEAMLSIVILAEELPARSRGFGIGVLGAMSGGGHAIASLLFALVNWLPFGWRFLYALGVIPLLLLAWFWRGLSETERFERHRRARRRLPGPRALLQPLRDLLRMYPGRLAALSLALFAWSFTISTALTFYSKFLQEAHGYAPGHVTAMVILGGALGTFGNIIGGALADRFGRRRVMTLALLANGLAVGLFYNTSGAWVVAGWIAVLFTYTGLDVLFAALGSELFPTSYRSTASGVRSAVATLGGALGLWLEGGLYTALGSHGDAISLMLLPVVLSPLIIALFLPESAGLELEEISPERS